MCSTSALQTLPTTQINQFFLRCGSVPFTCERAKTKQKCLAQMCQKGPLHGLGFKRSANTSIALKLLCLFFSSPLFLPHFQTSFSGLISSPPLPYSSHQVLLQSFSKMFHVQGREIAINAFYASLGCFAVTGKEKAKQEAAVPPTLLPVLPSAPATYHHGHRSGEYKKQNSQVPKCIWPFTGVQISHSFTPASADETIFMHCNTPPVGQQLCITLLCWLERKDRFSRDY